mgnify:CR=1 FL=1
MIQIAKIMIVLLPLPASSRVIPPNSYPYPTGSVCLATSSMAAMACRCPPASDPDDGSYHDHRIASAGICFRCRIKRKHLTRSRNSWRYDCGYTCFAFRCSDLVYRVPDFTGKTNAGTQKRQGLIRKQFQIKKR